MFNYRERERDRERERERWQVLAEVDTKAKAIYLDVQLRLNFLQELYLGTPADLNLFLVVLDVNLYDSLFTYSYILVEKLGEFISATWVFIYKLHVMFYFSLIQ